MLVPNISPVLSGHGQSFKFHILFLYVLFWLCLPSVDLERTTPFLDAFLCFVHKIWPLVFEHTAWKGSVLLGSRGGMGEKVAHTLNIFLRARQE